MKAVLQPDEKIIGTLYTDTEAAMLGYSEKSKSLVIQAKKTAFFFNWERVAEIMVKELNDLMKEPQRKIA